MAVAFRLIEWALSALFHWSFHMAVVFRLTEWALSTLYFTAVVFRLIDGF